MKLSLTGIIRDVSLAILILTIVMFLIGSHINDDKTINDMRFNVLIGTLCFGFIFVGTAIMAKKKD